MKVIVVGSTKGGVGKSTLAMMICDELAVRSGKTVLAIDHDPQGSLAKFMLPEGALQLNETDLWALADGRDTASLAAALRAIIRRDQSTIEAARDAVGRLDLIEPAAVLNAKHPDYSSRRFEAKPLSAWNTNLRAAFEQLGYDYVVIDTPGSDNVYTLPAIGLADALIVPVIPEPVTWQELDGYLDIVVSSNKTADRQALKGIVVFSQARNADHHLKEIERLRRDLSAAGYRHSIWVKVLKRRLMYRMDFGRDLFPRDRNGAYKKHRNIQQKYKDIHEDIVRAVFHEMMEQIDGASS